MSKLDEKIIADFLMGKCSEEELRTLNNWLDESEENARLLFASEELYCLGKAGDASADARKVEEAEKRLMQRLAGEEKTLRKKVLFRRWMQYAAIVVGSFFLGGAGYWVYWNARHKPVPMVTVVAGNTVKELMLPDGTKVWLNKNTTLQYANGFAGDTRLVRLEGEGYFDVKRNPAKPFIVQSEAMQVKVLGTVFNLKADKGAKAVATLLKGEVEVKGNRGEGMIVLSPGQQAELNGMTRKLTVKTAEPGIEGWHNTVFDLKQTDIYALCKILEKAYDVKIVLAPGIDTVKTYSGPLKKKETVGATLDLIKNSIGIQYKIVGGNVFVSPASKK